MRETAARLNGVIKESEEYRQYLAAKEKVMGNPELYEEMNHFRRRNYELQGYEDGINRYQDIYNLAVEFEAVLKNPDVNNFLKAEQVLIRNLSEMYEIIADGLEFDYDYME